MKFFLRGKDPAGINVPGYFLGRFGGVNLVAGSGDPDLTVLIGIPWRKESTMFQ